jgi:hypothetical protein
MQSATGTRLRLGRRTDDDLPHVDVRRLLDGERDGAGDRRGRALELAANAIVHARSPFSVTVDAHSSGVRLSVRDSSAVRPTVRPCDPRAESGRGLLLVAALSADWSVVVTADGKTVWADLRA